MTVERRRWVPEILIGKEPTASISWLVGCGVKEREEGVS